MKRAYLLAIVAATASLTGCDYSGDWLFPTVTETVPGVIDLGTMTPLKIESLEQMRAQAVYGEVGVTGTVDIGGMSLDFLGTGKSVCVYVDPETAYWSQSVAAQGKKDWFSWPDNHFDDGDIDLFGGASVYYSGSPGDTIGNFEVRYSDQLGNEIPVIFNECYVDDNANYPNGGAHSGRGRPEYCTVANTQLAVSYTIVLETFSPPRDDSRLGYTMILMEGDCGDLFTIHDDESNVEGILPADQGNIDPECYLFGESVKPGHAHDYREDAVLAVGSEAAAGFAWDGSIRFEELYCEALTAASTNMRDYCMNEFDALQAAGKSCNDDDVRCYCGDIRDTPTGGAF
ncbi:MAG: hypothetical protein ACI9MC_001191 [Kiritimatiellia bacterium]|jgi:hypothetical protein